MQVPGTGENSLMKISNRNRNDHNSTTISWAPWGALYTCRRVGPQSLTASSKFQALWKQHFFQMWHTLLPWQKPDLSERGDLGPLLVPWEELLFDAELCPHQAGRKSTTFCPKLQATLNLKTQATPRVSDEVWTCIRSIFSSPGYRAFHPKPTAAELGFSVALAVWSKSRGILV